MTAAFLPRDDALDPSNRVCYSEPEIRGTMKRHAVPLIALMSLASIAGCGSKSTSDALPTTSDALPTTSAPATSAPATSAPATTIPDTTIPEFDIADFCAAKVAFDGVNNDTPDEDAFDAYVAEASARAADIVSSAPPDIQEAATTVASTLAGLDNLDDGTAAHADEAYAGAREVLAVAVHDRCEFGRLTLDIANNTYSSATVEVTNGVTSVLVNNTDAVVHVTIIAKLADGVRADQLLANPELFEASATIVGVVVGGPDVADGTALALSPGNYIYFNPEYVATGMAGAFSIPA